MKILNNYKRDKLADNIITLYNISRSGIEYMFDYNCLTAKEYDKELEDLIDKTYDSLILLLGVNKANELLRKHKII